MAHSLAVLEDACREMAYGRQLDDLGDWLGYQAMGLREDDRPLTPHLSCRDDEDCYGPPYLPE